MHPAEVWLEYVGGTTPTNLYQRISKLVAGGVELTLQSSAADTFAFDSDTYGLDNGNLGTLII
jgi:hypothetical protein